MSRSTDSVSTDAALELVCTLAYEAACARGEQRVVEAVERAIDKLREMKLIATGTYPILTLPE